LAYEAFAVGFGLMALVFFSNRRGYDEPPVLIDIDANPTGDPDLVSPRVPADK
jgi:hypothetical protein